jgi:hypothetical protein
MPIIAVIQALRVNPGRYTIIFNNKNGNDFDNGNRAAAVVGSSSPSSRPYQSHYYNESLTLC